MGPDRVTKQTLAVIEALLREPAGWWYGLELARLTGLPSGTIYPVLGRLHGRWGWLESQWESEAPHGRPPRRLYRLTGAGERAAAQLLAEQPETKKKRPERSPKTGSPRTLPI